MTEERRSVYPLWPVGPVEFQSILDGNQRALVFPGDQPKPSIGRTLRVHLEEHGSGPPYVLVYVTHVRTWNTKAGPIHIASIERGLGFG